MKKKILALVTLLILISIVFFLTGCSNKEETTNTVSDNEEISNVENNEIIEEEKIEETLSGIFVAEDDFYLEGVIVIKNPQGYNVIIREGVGTFSDEVDSSEVTDNTISSDFMAGSYTITPNNDGIVFNAEEYGIENLEMKPASGALDGIYQDGDGYLVLYTLASGDIRITHIDNANNTSTLKLEDVTITDNTLKCSDISNEVNIDITKGEGFIAKFTDSTEEWNEFSGGYVKVEF